jgi:hypothetical protein
MIAVLAVAVRVKVGAWTHPACLFSIFWAVMICLPLMMVPQISADPWAAGYLGLAALAFSAPAFVRDWKPALAAASARAEGNWGFTETHLIIAFVVCQIITLGLIAANLDAQGFPLSMAVTNPVVTACEYLKIRYDGIFEPNFFSKSGTFLNYFGAILAGLILGSRKSILLNCGIIVLAVLPSLLYMMMYADKGTVFLALAYLFGAVIVSRIARGETYLLRWRTIAAGVIVVALLAPALAVSLFNRSTAGQCSAEGRTKHVFERMASVSAKKQEDSNPGMSGGFGFYARSYAFGHYFAFSDWFSSYTTKHGEGYTNPENRTLGFWTFMALGRHLNPSYTLPPGYFSEYYHVDGVLMTNIYTMYRGLIYDFGIAGSLAFMLVAGFISSQAYRTVLLKEAAPISQAYLIFLIGYIYTSYIISLLIWNSAWIVPPAVGFMLWLRSRYNRRLKPMNGATRI